MRIPLVALIFLSCLACNPKMSTKFNNNDSRTSNYNQKERHFDDWYDSFLGDDERKLYSDYVSMISQKGNEIYVRRVFFPETRTMTHYNEFLDIDLGDKQGEEKVFSDKGKLIYEVEYNDGVELGLARSYDRNTGKLVSEGNFRNGEKNGIWKTYDSEGTLKGETSFKNDLKEGNFIGYGTNGEITVKSEYRADTIYKSQLLKLVENLEPMAKSEKMPMYGDGCPDEETMVARKSCSERKMLEVIYRNLHYPAIAREYNVEGMAIASFVIDTTGQITEIEMIRGITQDISDEVIRVIQLLDSWVPGEQDGKKVKVKFTLPVRFKLE